MIFFSADTHFGRANILQTAKRPFDSPEDMDRAIMTTFRIRMRDDDDDLYFLGDLAHKTDTEDRLKPWFDELPGRKHLIIGNHDNEDVQNLPWESVQHYLELDVDGTHIVMNHYPLMTWNQARAGSIHLFGHIHNNWRGSKRAVNVGVDMWGWGPCSLHDIKLRAETLDDHPFWDVIEP